MPPTLAAADRQATWQPLWLLECAALPHTYATRDLSIPGGLHAWGRIIDSPTVTRTIVDPFWPLVEVQDLSVKVADSLTGDYAGQPVTLSRYDVVSGLQLIEFRGTITRTIVDRDGTTIEGSSVDRGQLEKDLPRRGAADDEVAFPLADPSTAGAIVPWVFGNVASVPLLNVADDVELDRFDYLVCRGEAAAITGMRRLARDTATTTAFDIAPEEMEAYPGEDVVENASVEDWDAGTTVAPTGWVLNGAGATIVKVIKSVNPNRVDEGEASAQVTRVGADCALVQTISANTTLPMAFWQGRSLTLTMRVRATAASRAYIYIADNVANTFSAPHSGSSNLETLTVTHTLDAAATAVFIGAWILTGNTSAQFDTARVTIAARSWEEVLRTDLYPGYTAVRFFARQDDGTGALYPIVADVHGWQPERNPVRAIRTMLSDPTHGLGRTVDATNADAAELAACFTRDDVVRLYAPELYLPFTDLMPYTTVPDLLVARDRSGHERHGTYTPLVAATDWLLARGTAAGIAGGTGSVTYLDLFSAVRASLGSHVDVPDSLGFNPDGGVLSIECGFSPSIATAAAGLYPIMERLNGAATLTGYGLYRNTAQWKFFVHSNGGTLTTLSVAVAGGDTATFLHFVGVAAAGTLTLYKNGVSIGTTAYPGTLDTNHNGHVKIGAFGTGGVPAGKAGLYKSPAIYRAALTPAQVTALYAAFTSPTLEAEPISDYDTLIPQTLYYWLAEGAGDPTLWGTVNGTWTGGPDLGTTMGPMNPQRGRAMHNRTVRFANNAAMYGTVAGQTLAGTAGTVALFYRPEAKHLNGGIVEKTVGGVIATQWGFAQRRATGKVGAVRFTFKTSAATYTLDAPLTKKDRNQWQWFLATWAGTTLTLYMNGDAVASTTFAGTPSSGVGNLYFGIQGGLVRPGLGAVSRVSYANTAVTAADVAALWLAATWYNGGLMVDLAMTEARQAREWIAQVAQLRGIRLGFTGAGAITFSVDATAPSVIQYNARDGAGDGERTLLDIGRRQKPSPEDRVRDVVVQYRRSPSTGIYKKEIRRVVNTLTDSTGNRIGRDREFLLDAVREHPTADRFADYVAKRLAASEDRVDVTLHQEARRLEEGDLIQITDAFLGYAGAVMEMREVGKALETISGVAQGWDEGTYTYTPGAFPLGAKSG